MSKNFSPRFDPINLPRRLREGLQKADDLLEQGESQQALEILSELNTSFPRQPDVLGLMANANLDMNNQHGYLQAIHELHELTPNRAEVKLGLAGAYLSNGYPALALQTFHQFLKRWSHDERAADVQKTIPQLEDALRELLQDLGDSLETGFEFACQHEEIRLLMELGNYTHCRQLAKKLLQLRPGFVPILNNLSQVDWLEGDLPGAIETSRKVLEIDPQNVHALSNLTRYLFMQGKKEEAWEFAKRLKDSSADAAERWVKVGEALSFIGDDDGLLSLFDQAKNTNELDQWNENLWHWCAAAEYRKGNISAARKNWQASLKRAPYFSLAGKNLDELKKPQHERACPLVFPLEMWITRKILESLISATKRAANQKNDAVFRAKVAEDIERHPELIHFVPAALASGDEHCKEFAINLADMSAHPAILDSLKEFSLGQNGSDALRMEAAQMLTKHGIFKSGETIDLWIEGESRPLMMLGFQISYDAQDRPQLKPAAQRLMEQAIYALRNEDSAKAEIHLRKALEIQQDEPGLFNNLAVALSMQGKHDESRTIADEIPKRFPDYFFGQVVAVRKAIQAHDLKTAQSVLDKMMQKQELHVTEFGALCACQIDYMIESDKPEGAVSWFEMWEQGYPDDPSLKNYEHKVAMIDVFAKLKNGFPKPRRKNKKRVN
jgi:tetratricopeptide (TPR) repeat protein